MRIYRWAADLVTASRAALAPFLVWLGLSRGQESLPAVVFLMLADWVADLLDGSLARLDKEGKPSWLGGHDLGVDMFVALGLWVYMVAAGFVSVAWGVVYLLSWMLYFTRQGVTKVTGEFFQVFVYAYFLWLASQQAPEAAIWVLYWVLIALAITWRRFAFDVVPEFLHGVGRLLRH